MWHGLVLEGSLIEDESFLHIQVRPALLRGSGCIAGGEGDNDGEERYNRESLRVRCSSFLLLGLTDYRSSTISRCLRA